MFENEKTTKRLLIVEQNKKTRNTLLEFLQPKYDCEEADGIGAAFEKIAESGFDVVISNFQLNDTDGFELLSSVQFTSPRTAVILNGENVSAKDVIEAFRAGAFDFLEKPFELKELETAVERAIRHNRSKISKSDYEKRLEEIIANRNASLDKALEDIQNSYRMTLKALIQALETRDFETYGHSERVVTFSLRLAHELGLEKEKMRDLELGALLHDIGKIGIPDAILRKPAELTEQEWKKMKLHPILGAKILRNIPFLQGAAKVVAQHHERWDGTGYPNNLRGEKIDICARIFAVADAFDAMLSNRVYKKCITYEKALSELKKNAGTQFDPLVVEVFEDVPKEDWETLRSRSLKARTEVLSFQDVVLELVQSQKYFEMVH